MAEIRTISNIMSVDEGIITTVGGETFDASEVLGGLAGGTQYTIAAPNSVNKDRADLILTADYPETQINNAFIALDNARNNDPTVAVRVDFLGGKIETLLEILVPFDNFHLYGNGVDIEATSRVDSTACLTGNNIIFTGFNCIQVSHRGGEALRNTGDNCTITGNTLEGTDYGLYNTGEGCTITGNILEGYYYYGLSDTNESLINKTIIIGNTGSISVQTGSCLPATQAAMADVNNSSVTFRA